MKANSNQYPESYIDLGKRGYFNYNIKATTISGVTSYDYESIEIPYFDKSSIIEGIIREKYSLSDELSLINNFNDGLYVDEYNQYQIEKKKKKIIADQHINNVKIPNLTIGNVLIGNLSDYNNYQRHYEFLGVISNNINTKELITKFAIRHFINNVEDSSMLKIITFTSNPDDYDTIMSMLEAGYGIGEISSILMTKLDDDGTINAKCLY